MTRKYRLRVFARRGQELARDMRVCWAFEEVGQPYGVRLVSTTALKACASEWGPSTFEPTSRAEMWSPAQHQG